jgi:glucose/arabinose dehydrogenase
MKLLFRRPLLLMFFLNFSCLFTSCYWMRPSAGGGQRTTFTAPRTLSPAAIALPEGYTAEIVATGLTFPTGLAFDGQGRLHVVESGYAYGEVFEPPRLLRVGTDGSLTPLATGATRSGPWNGVTFHDGSFFVADGGVLEGGKILRISPEGSTTTLVDNLPGYGDHHSNGPAIGPDGYVYFGQGTATNAAIVGTDNADYGWLPRRPTFHDIPCQDIELTGRNYTSDNPLTETSGDRATTGAFSPFGTATTEGQVITGQLPCSGSVMRIPATGGPLELVAWGFRNPFGLAFAPDGRLYVTDNSYDDRGSRPVWGVGDYLWAVQPGTWYGWPDFSGGRPLASSLYDKPGGSPPEPLLRRHPNEPPQAAARFGVHASACGLDFSRSSAFGYEGEAFVAEFGDLAPAVGKILAPVGYKVVRVNPETGAVEDFAVNRGRRNGPATRYGTGGLERPVAVKFSPDGRSLYIVDFGVVLMDGEDPKPQKNTGVIWRISRKEGI